jgi:hypothetical protein
MNLNPLAAKQFAGNFELAEEALLVKEQGNLAIEYHKR